MSTNSAYRLYKEAENSGCSKQPGFLFYISKYILKEVCTHEWITISLAPGLTTELLLRCLYTHLYAFIILKNCMTPPVRTNSQIYIMLLHPHPVQR